MMLGMDGLWDEILKLSAAERIQLVEDIWDSIAAEPDTALPLTDAQLAEIDRRLADHAKNPERARSWDEVRARLWSRPG
jgi:putative addiction module component (TIGR02574 family)